MTPKLAPGFVPYGTIHKPTIAALKEIKRIKNELATVMFKYYLSLRPIDKEYLDLMLDDEDVNTEYK